MVWRGERGQNGLGRFLVLWMELQIELKGSVVENGVHVGTYIPLPWLLLLLGC